MKDKATFWKNMSVVIVVALMGILLIASYFIPVIGPSDVYKDSDTDKTYSCYDIVVAMNATSMDDLNESQETAIFAISENEGKAGQIVRVVGILGMINAMVGAVILVCAIATVFFKHNILRTSTMAFAISAALVSIAIISLICSYLGIVTESTYPYSFYNSIHASSFVMLAASLFAGVGSWFLGFFDNKKERQE